MILPPFWTVIQSTLLFPEGLIYLLNPFVSKGTQLQFQCQSPKSEYESSNLHDATISPSGLLEARKKGKTVIKCRPNIKTTTFTVVEFKSVSLKKVDDSHYGIENNFPKSNFTFHICIRYKLHMQMGCFRMR